MKRGGLTWKGFQTPCVELKQRPSEKTSAVVTGGRLEKQFCRGKKGKGENEGELTGIAGK